MEKKEIRVKELSEWFDDKTQERYDSINEQTKISVDAVKNAVEELKEHLKILEETEIKNPEKIQDKVRHIVISHRTSYIRVLIHFANSLDFPENVNFIEGERLSYDIDEGLNNLAKNTMKSYQATQHLFSDALNSVTSDLKKFAELARDIKDNVKKSGITEIEKTKELIKNILSEIRKKKDFGIQLEENGKVLLSLENTCRKFENMKKEIMESGNFKRLNDAKKEIDKIDGEVSRKRNEITELFSSLDSGFKKYSRVAVENIELIEDYANSSFDALLKDKELKIINILQRMKQSINSGSVDLRDHKKDKALETIEKINEDKLKKVVVDYKELKDKKDYEMQRVNKNPVKSQIKEIEYKEEHNSFKLKKLKEDIENLEKDYNKIKLEELKQKIEEKIKEIIKIDLIISLVS